MERFIEKGKSRDKIKIMSSFETFLLNNYDSNMFAHHTAVFSFFMCWTVTGGTTKDLWKAQDGRVFAVITEITGVSSSAI